MAVKYDKESKTYYVRVSYKDSVTGKYRTKNKYNFKRKKDAEAWERKKKNELDKGVDLGENPVFADAFLKWFELYREAGKADSTVTDYNETHGKIKMYFKDVRIKSVDRDYYQSFLLWLGKEFEYNGQKGLAKSTNKKTHQHIKSFSRFAEYSGLTSNDFTFETTVVGHESKEIQFLSQNESTKLIQALYEDQRGNGLEDHYLSRWMILTALCTGFAYEEVGGLTYSDFVDLYLTINKAWDFRKKDFKDTKTPSRKRTIKIENSFAKQLRSFIVRRKEKELAGIITNPKKLIFSKYDGEVPNNRSVNKALKLACQRAGVKTITFHELRHTHVSLLIYGGMDITSISKRVGHSNPKVTLGYYSHVIDELEAKNESRSDEVVNSILSAT